MKGRSTLLMGLLFAVFAVGVWYLEFERAPELDADVEESAEVALLADADFDRLVRIELTTETAPHAIVLEREVPPEEAGSPSPWRLTAPVDAPVDDSAVDGLVSALRGLEGEPVASVADDGLAPFGLDRSTVGAHLVFSVAGGKGRIERTVRVGNKTPVGYQAYVQVAGRPDIHIVPSYFRTSLDKSPFELRRKKLTSFAAPDVRALTLERAGEQIALERRDGAWRIVTPVDARASSQAVDALVDGLTGLRAVSYEDGAVPEAEKAAFEAPRLAVSVAVASDGADRTERLAFADPSDAGGDVEVLRDGAGPVARIRPETLDPIDKRLEDLRDRRALVFDRDAVAAVEIAGHGAELRVERTLADASDEAPGDAAPGAWALAAPDTGDVDQSDVNQMLIALSALEVESFLDGTTDSSVGESGLEEPELDLRLLGADDRELARLRVGAVRGGDDAEQRYARVAGEPGLVVLSSRFLEDVPRSAADLAPAPAAAPADGGGEATGDEASEPADHDAP